MLLRIDVNSENVLRCENGQIIIKLPYYTSFAHGAYLTSFDGYTLEEYEEAFNATGAKAKKLARKFKKSKSLYVGVGGGLSLE